MTPPTMMLLVLVCMFVGAYLTLTFLMDSTWLAISGFLVSIFGPQIAFAHWDERQRLKRILEELDREQETRDQRKRRR